MSFHDYFLCQVSIRLSVCHDGFSVISEARNSSHTSIIPQSGPWVCRSIESAAPYYIILTALVKHYRRVAVLDSTNAIHYRE
jgi:hypothetical protein